ncbi:hypothetical protein U879_14800 [Defluviimonas sp. 20V17]|uniref:DUF3291 domain-containing protein n=1 Tax=Allgaiera indica TaxID=765699 RepID=A0AAN4UQQ7_9RHOB|nr:DUF3291 domain-containing protein [Allgaiera indica]KDB02944.1 hypothetical protein U879_14800 [Defluviimonas sp. 20V17]GHE01434.1 hypothetical protein GCM10008024_16890 [Allgaiera indica]SDW86696.1 protein of unknown function [Allgaiera indica]
MQPTGHHIAELNFGVLRHDWDDPRVKDFVDGLDLVNGVAARSPGFVWRLGDDAMEAEQNDPEGALGGNPRTASTLSVWEDVASLEAFVWNTVHRRFYERRAEWYDAVKSLRFVMWWVPEGHRPGIAEGMARFRHFEAHGDSDHAFGWAHLKDAQLWKTRGCSPMAAE